MERKQEIKITPLTSSEILKLLKSIWWILAIMLLCFGMLSAQCSATKSEAELFGNWQMSDASWQTEQMNRQYGLGNPWFSNVMLREPSGFFSLEAQFCAFDLTTLGSREHRVNGDFKYDGYQFISELPVFGTRMATVEWISDDVVEVENESGAKRRYIRQ